MRLAAGSGRAQGRQLSSSLESETERDPFAAMPPTFVVGSALLQFLGHVTSVVPT